MERVRAVHNTQGYAQHTNATSRGIRVPRRAAVNIGISLCGFLIGRLATFGGLNPAAYMTVAPFLGDEGGWLYLASLSTAAGLISRFSLYYTPKYLLALGVILCAGRIAARLKQGMGALAKSAICASALAVCAVIAPRPVGLGLYFFCVALLECALSFCLCFISIKGCDAISGREEISPEGAVSALAIFAAAAAGVSDVSIGVISLKYLLCAYFTVAAAYAGGSAFGGCAGLLAGLLINLCGFSGAEFPVVLGICGITAGLFKKAAKPLIAAGFVVGSFIGAFYAGVSYYSFGMVVSTLTACAAFVVTPNAAFRFLSPDKRGERGGAVSRGELVKQTTIERIRGLARALDKLHIAVDKTPRRIGLNKEEAGRVVDDVAAKVCEGCARREFCWGESYIKTAKLVYEMLYYREQNGEWNGDCEFYSMCENASGFTGAGDRYLELYREKAGSIARLEENRGVLATQVGGLSAALTRLCANIDDELTFRPELERKLIGLLTTENAEVDFVVVTQNKRGRLEALFNRRGGFAGDIGALETIAGKALRRHMRGSAFVAPGEKAGGWLRLVEAQNFCVTYGLARRPKDNGPTSGDCYSLLEYRDGMLLMALSDGMGTGERAHCESETAIGLLEDFAQSGVDDKTTIELINAAMNMRGGEDTFTTLDICRIDLYTAAAELIKLGAASTYILTGDRRRETRVIVGNALPVGILQTAEPDITETALNNGDIVVMVTDGVEDAGGAGWIGSALNVSNYKDPQRIADYLLETALAYRAGGDDMTVLCAKVWERNM